MQLHSIGIKPFAALFILLCVGPLVAGFFIHRQTDSLNHPAFWGILAVSGMVFMALLGAMLNRSVEMDGGYLVVKSTFYKKRVELARISDIKRVKPKSADDILGIRVNGIGLPGYRSGWFNVKTGGKIFVDRGCGEFFLIFVDEKPAFALEFDDSEWAELELRRIRDSLC